mmetsp:Transcript_133105/g.302122  ORF Transcript_133105/g.302122 Transcript_133105/m.302122 type:complete len:93 (-) Transcript_133105:148-426(-)
MVVHGCDGTTLGFAACWLLVLGLLGCRLRVSLFGEPGRAAYLSEKGHCARVLRSLAFPVQLRLDTAGTAGGLRGAVLHPWRGVLVRTGGVSP